MLALIVVDVDDRLFQNAHGRVRKPVEGAGLSEDMAARFIIDVHNACCFDCRGYRCVLQ